VNQIRKARIAAQGIEKRMHFDVLQNVGLFFVCFFQPGECLLFVA